MAAVAVGAAIGLGTYYYVNNELQRNYGASYEKVWEASSKALRDLEMKDIAPSKDALKGILYARRSDGAEIKVVVEKLTDNSAKVSIRTGTFESDSNRRASELIHDQIARNLGVR